MKKIIFIMLMVIVTLFPSVINAKGSLDISTTKLEAVVGSTKTITINLSNAAGKIDISSANSKIATVSSSSVFLDNQSTKVTITAKSIGKTTVTIKAADVTTYDDEILTGKTYVINVTVVAAPEVKAPDVKTTISNNNKLKSIQVSNYDLTKVNDNKYTLTVNNDVDSININAVAEDSKAEVKGDGTYVLNYGENNIEILITSESGIKNIISLFVTRKFETNPTDDEEDDENIIISEPSQETNDDELKEPKPSKWKLISLIELVVIIIELIVIIIYVIKESKNSIKNKMM